MGEEAKSERNSANLTDNYYLQHRNVMIFGSILIFIQASGAIMSENIETPLGVLGFEGSINLSFVVLCFLIYSFMHFVAEWFWQARQQYDFGVAEIESIAIRLESEIAPLRTQIDQAATELRATLSRFGEISEIDSSEALDPAESKLASILGGITPHADFIKNFPFRMGAEMPNGYASTQGDSIIKSDRQFSKLQIQEDFDFVIEKYADLQFDMKELINQIGFVDGKYEIVLEMLKARARRSIEGIDRTFLSLNQIEEKYDKISFPRKIKNRLFRTRLAAWLLTWGFGLAGPVLVTSCAIAAYAFPCFRDALKALVLL